MSRNAAKKPALVVKPAPPTTARKLSIVKPSTELATTPARKEFSQTFVKKAQKNDAAIDRTLEEIGKGYAGLGILFRESKQEGYHAALGFLSFADYCEAKSGKGKTQVYEAMRIVGELSTGTNPPVSVEDLGDMTQENAKGLVGLKKKGIKITPKLVEQAKTLSAKEFQEKVVYPQNPEAEQRAAVATGRVIATGAEVSFRLTYNVTKETAAMVKKAEEMFRKVGDKPTSDLPFADLFLQALCGEFFASSILEYNDAKAEEEAQGYHAAVMADAGTAPEPEEDDLDLIDPEEASADDNTER